MLTKDENVVTVAMDVQYRVADPYKYLYRVTNADDSLRQATDSALRAVIGDSLMDSILTSGRQQIRQTTQETLNQIIDSYDMGIVIVDVNFQSARPPEQVKDALMMQLRHVRMKSVSSVKQKLTKRNLAEGNRSSRAFEERSTRLQRACDERSAWSSGSV